MKKMGKNLIESRIKLTKRGKILRRPSHIGHNQAKKKSKVKRSKRGLISASHLKKDIFKIYH
ncbi:MAG TPA: hypothetical protein PL164_00710 [Candidatus Paceibacterota bacterium]|nr:hypothetical protein [Candidatus Paceibacterota bacterium]HOK97298.1 hypothetical protein [Candidatus Paceibacterota bacterium]HPP64734.1 hypothetical protein [Candidatus Paceibacterota bacterium]